MTISLGISGFVDLVTWIRVFRLKWGCEQEAERTPRPQCGVTGQDLGEGREQWRAAGY